MKTLWTSPGAVRPTSAGDGQKANADGRTGALCRLVAGAILAVFLALGPTAHHAMADGGEFSEDAHGGGKCDGNVRISKSRATCLTASWHQPKWNAAYIRVWATNECAAYGDMIAHVDVKNNNDIHFHLDDGQQQTENYGDAFDRVRDVNCCINRGDNICWKAQVEKNNSEHPNHILRIEVSGNSHQKIWSPVYTHLQRYNFCQRYPDQIYCDVDPDGDAHKAPESVCAATNSCNCGDHFCTTGDCDWHWKRSPAYKAMSADPAEPHCKELYTNYISASDGSSQTCDIRMKCWNGYRWSNGDPIITWAEARMNVWLIDDLRYCQPPANKPTDYGHLTTGSC